MATGASDNTQLSLYDDSLRRVLLVDGDIVAYRAASAAEVPINWGGGLWTLHAFEQEVERHIRNYVYDLKEKTEACEVVMCLSDPEANFRKEILPSYKSNRKDTRKPMLLTWAKEFLHGTYPTVQRPSLEGDDVMGILSTHPKVFPGADKVIVSIDKDMQTIPGSYLKDSDPDERIRQVSLEEADYWHLFQALTGDATDGYAGCPGIGEKAAHDLLSDPRPWESYEHTIASGKRKGQTETRWHKGEPCSQWQAIVSAYEKAGLTADDALQQARVARILRAEDYDFKNKRPLLWTPKETNQ